MWGVLAEGDEADGSVAELFFKREIRDDTAKSKEPAANEPGRALAYTLF